MEVSYTPDEKRFCKDCRYYIPGRATNSDLLYLDGCTHPMNQSLVDGTSLNTPYYLRYEDQFSCGKLGDWWEAK